MPGVKERDERNGPILLRPAAFRKSSLPDSWHDVLLALDKEISCYGSVKFLKGVCQEN
jgi:hypothetical protein